MSKRKMFLAALAAVGMCAPAWAINKCTGPDGKVYFQDTPCAASHKGGEIAVNPSGGYDDQDAASRANERTQVQLAKSRQRDAIHQGIATGEPVIGMNTDELQQALGAPSKVNAGNYGGTRKDQVIFYKPGGTWYVYTKNGIVESIQFSQDTPVGWGKPARCPSELELRNLRVSANSISAGPTQQEAYKRALDDARACKQ